MARYNVKQTPKQPDVINHQGGGSYQLDPKMEMVSILATGFDNTYYEKLTDRETRFKTLIVDIAKKEPEFVAKALVYSRAVLGQRSVSQFGAVALTPLLSGRAVARKFFSKRDKKSNKGGIVFRLDDILEIVACYQHFNPGKPLPNSMKKGFKAALEAADAYELAKYQGKNKQVSLVDVINLVHPTPSEMMQETFKQLMTGTLKQFNTVEDKNTKAGQEVAAKVKAGTITKVEAEKELQVAKESNYAELIKTRKIGYLALLRNLRNIVGTTNNAELIKEACEILTDQKLIKQSLVFPHQIDIALEVLIQEVGASKALPFVKACDKAYELAIPNLTELFAHGRTAVVFDSSGSMSSMIKLANKNQGSKSAIEKAALIAATLAKGINADVFHFADRTEGIKFNPLDSVNTLKNQFMKCQGRVGYGTSFHSIFSTIGKNYDRVFVISDMQGNSSLESYAYKNMHVYSIDLVGYGTAMFKPGNKVYPLYGYSAEMYEMVKRVELDPKAIIKAIEAIEI
jgi:60 kDa SS-A/Ro ribonucleoprotein